MSKSKSAMKKPKARKNGTDVEPSTEGSTGRVSMVDPFERFGFNEWPAWFGRRWPDRIFGDVSSMLDHIKVEEYVEDGTLVVRGELPGVDPDNDIEITVDRGRLTIQAERTSRSKEEHDGFRSEFRYGSFSRVVSLPEGADADDVEASYVDGILEVRVPLGDEDDRDTTKVQVKRG